jgi:hypothetical protein
MSSGLITNIIGSILDLSDTSKQFVVGLSGSTTGVTNTLSFSSTANRVYTIPDATTALVGTDTGQVLTNKTINGSLNTITNITNASLVNTSVTISAGTGLTGGGSTPLGSTSTINLSVPVSSTNGGTGINNGASTITLGGSLVTSGSSTLTLTTTGGTNVTLPTSGTLLTSATAVTSFNGGSTGLGPSLPSSGAITLTGVLSASSGGTGNQTYVVGDLLYANATNTLTRLADVATGNALISGGAGAAPSWGKIGLTTAVTGTLPIVNGGTAFSTTPSNGQLLIGNGTNYTLAAVTAGTAITVTNGAGSITIASTASRRLYAATSTLGPIANPGTVSVTMFPSTGQGSLTIGANTLAVGSIIRFEIDGTQRIGTDTAVTLTVLLGGVTIGTGTSPNNYSATSADRPFTARGTLTCRTTGATGTAIGHANHLQSDTAVAQNAYGTTTVTNATINTTTSLVFDFQFQYGTNNANNTFTVTNANVWFDP